MKMCPTCSMPMLHHPDMAETEALALVLYFKTPEDREMVIEAVKQDKAMAGYTIVGAMTSETYHR